MESKGLDALKNIFSHWNCCNPNSNGCDENDFDLVEKELKAYYELESMHEELAKAYNKLCVEKLEWLKQKKVLEIIKEKPNYLQFILIFETWEDYYKEYGEWDKVKPNTCYTKEQFDLLKEVML